MGEVETEDDAGGTSLPEIEVLFPNDSPLEASFQMNPSRCVNAVGSISGLAGVLPAGTCCSCCCCPSVNFSFFKTTEGVMKLLEVILGVVCQNLLVNYGVTYSVSLGTFYYSFLTTVSASALTSLVLLLCYVVSPRTLHLEPLFNGIVSFLYLSSSCYFAFAIYTFLFPVYKILSIFQGYPAMNAIYIIGFILGGIHGYDSWQAYKRYS